MTDDLGKAKAREVADSAAFWFARLQDEPTGEDWRAFDAWIRQSPDHEAAYSRLEGIWSALDEVAPEAAAALARGGASVGAGRRARHRGPVRQGWRLAVGAGLAATLAVGVFQYQLQSPGALQVLEAAPGVTRQVALADGTKVWLNAGSRLDIRLGKRQRSVQMADGEAVFDVAHDPGRPFVIEVADRQIRVVGTQFDLRHRDARLSLAVRRGIVEVRSREASGAPVRLAAGQRLEHRDGASLTTVSTLSSDDAFAWTDGQLVFEDATLSQVVEELSRSLGIPVRVEDAATAALKFTGVIDLKSRSDLEHRLQGLLGVQVRREGDTLILGRRPVRSAPPS